MKKPKKTILYGYVGQYFDGDLGWFSPSLLSTYKNSPAWPDIKGFERDVEGAVFYKCRFVVTPMKNKRGKLIRRVLK